ncbi:MAG TPA: hypothetical protein VLJ37_02770 [bacterium]|nr:hypothetical protein [bacterium]
MALTTPIIASAAHQFTALTAPEANLPPAAFAPGLFTPLLDPAEDRFSSSAAIPLSRLTSRTASPAWPAMAVLAVGLGLAVCLAGHASISGDAALAMASGPLLAPGLIERLNRWLRRIQARLEEIARDAVWSMTGPVDPITHESWRIGKLMDMEDIAGHPTQYELIRHRFKHLPAEERLVRAEGVLRCFSKYRYRSNPLALLALEAFTGHLVSWLSADERRTLLLHFTESGGIKTFPRPLLKAMTAGFPAAERKSYGL